MDNLYKEQILDHWKNPRNFIEGGLGKLGKGWVRVREGNASCGDYFEIGLNFEISDVKFSGEGCVLSAAAFSLLTDKIKNEKLKTKNLDRIRGEDMEDLIGVKVSSGRRACVMLAYEALKKAKRRQVIFKQTAKVLKKGGVIIFPTDTVWGIGALATAKKGIAKLYKIKGREKSKPTAILVSNIKQAKQYGEIKGKALELANQHWPGALTLVVKGVGLRVPDHNELRAFLGYLGEGIMAGSANFAGKSAPKDKKAIDKRLVSMVDVMVEGVSGGIKASTVVKVSGDNIKIVRMGSVKIK